MTGVAASRDAIVRAEAWLCDLPVETVRTDAMQSFLSQETIFVRIETASGATGLGYSYTIGTGGGAVLDLLRTVLLDAVTGLDASRHEAVWRAMISSTRATTVGAVSSLAFAAIDTAVWDVKAKSSNAPLWIAAGGARESIPLYDTEGGWLHLSGDELVESALSAQRHGLGGVKIKVGKPRGAEDAERLRAVRDAVGWGFDIMVDANQAFTAAEAIRRAAQFDDIGLAWFEEPLPAEDVSGHASLARSSSIPIAVGESMYSIGHFKEYLHAGAASILQPDVARIGGITPWLKVAHLAEAYNVAVAPHFLMELHVALTCAVPNSLYLEHIPQLRALTNGDMAIESGAGVPSDTPGLGIDWNLDAIDGLRVR
ncbi:mandelate racemase/muconate lactonizing enzyme family protein [Frondihabitans sp. PAMC 28766]|uniref:mandelate racemase/muconate lactonizing enzyme family protein n=1 Tax=Frondihabitans sp. PAMC 28766 TaxID=1795630 RepID=UPI0009E66528|nr:mandelate racemase/muconate lactonizing enzyme family protein [Frondihabitans sp. PAMC 28766]